MDAEGEVLAEHDGPREVAAFKQTAAKAQRYLELRAVADPTPAQKLDLFVAELEMGKLDLAAAKARKATLGTLTPEQEARISTALCDLEVMDILEKTQQPAPGEETKLRAELGKRFHDMLQAGQRPSGDQPFQAFWGLIMDWAEQEKNVAAFEEALGAMRERFGKLPQAGQFFKQQEERLARLRTAAAAPR
jgi:hypothetical protein